MFEIKEHNNNISSLCSYKLLQLFYCIAGEEVGKRDKQGVEQLITYLSSTNPINLTN